MNMCRANSIFHVLFSVLLHTLYLTSSFNYSAAAEQDNNKNLIVIKSTDLATTYEQEFQNIWNKST